MKVHKIVLYSFVMLALVVSGVFTTRAIASTGDHKVGICHATSSGTNPFNAISVDKNSTAGGHSTDTNDIIPPFTYYEWEVVGSHQECPSGGYGSWAPGKTCIKNGKYAYPETVLDYDWVAHTYAGLNYDALGQAILRNGCEIPPAEGECPTTCGYAGGTVPDGLGGVKTCPATDPCDAEGECPTKCGYAGGEVPDGQGGFKTCPATDLCDAEGECPTKCGYAGGEVPDGEGGYKVCPATKACTRVCGIPDAPPCDVCPGEPAEWNVMVSPSANVLNFIWTIRDKCNYTWNQVTHSWESPHMNPENWRSYGISTVPFTLIWAGQYLPAQLMSDGYWFISAPPDGTWIIIAGTYEGEFSWADWPNLTRIRDSGVVVFHYESCRGAVLDDYK